MEIWLITDKCIPVDFAMGWLILPSIGPACWLWKKFVLTPTMIYEIVALHSLSSSKQIS